MLAYVLALVALLIMFSGLYFLDLPIIRFMRSLQNSWGIPNNLWLGRWSDWGDWVGKGEVLFTISGLLLIGGWIGKQQRWRLAGIESAVAHALSGLLGLAIKYAIGRPRPKFMHGEEWVMAPSLESGMHSFPSGHSSASFAVATVLAKYFPRIAWMVYGAAAMITVSRVIRGAHFPSDVAVGMALGMLMGALVSNPMGNRWQSVQDMLVKAALAIGVLFTIIWVATHVPHPDAWRTFSTSVGILLILGGMGVRFAKQSGYLSGGPWIFSLQLGAGLIGLGLVVSTGSYLLILVGSLLVIAQVLSRIGPGPSEIQMGTDLSGKGKMVTTEGLVAVISIAAFLLLQGMTGTIPLF